MNLEMSLEELLDKIFPLPKLEDNIAYTYADRGASIKAELLRRDKEKDERIQFIWQWFEHYKVRAETAEAEAEAYIKPLIAQYNAEQERIRQEEEARLREEARKQEEERILREAAEAEKNGHKDEAEAIINEPVQVTPVIVPKSVPKVQGISFQKYGNIALSIRL